MFRSFHCEKHNVTHGGICFVCRGEDHAATPQPAAAAAAGGALGVQEGGTHYKAMNIQPFEYIHANGIAFAEGCVIKYVSRWRAKGGVEDLKKARHFLDLLIEAEGEAS